MALPDLKRVRVWVVELGTAGTWFFTRTDNADDSCGGVDSSEAGEGWPRQESNLRTRIRSPPLCPLSYGARERV